MLKILNYITIVFALCILSACAATGNVKQSKDPKSNIIAKTPNETTNVEIDGNKKVCKRKASTGSRFKTKICMTADQWQQTRENAVKNTREFQRKGAQAGNPRGG